MALLSSKSSIKNKPAHNFSQKITQPTSVVIFCSSDFIEFISSLWGMGILLQYYSKPTVVLQDKEWEMYIKKIYPECEFSTTTIPEFLTDNEISSVELAVLLTDTLTKDVLSALDKMPLTVIAGISTFSDIHILSCIISVNELQSHYYQFFSFATQLTGSSEDWQQYTQKYKFIIDRSFVPENMGMICIDISPGKFDTRFSKKQIYDLVNGLHDSFPIDIMLIDRDRNYYEKLAEKKFKKKPELLIIGDYCRGVEILKSARLLIGPNTPLIHCMNYTALPTFCIMVPHERKYLSKSSKNRIFVVQRFSTLKAKDILPEIQEILK